MHKECFGDVLLPICTCVCVCVCMCVCMRVRACVLGHACISVCMREFACVSLLYICVCMCVSECVCACVYVCVRVCWDSCFDCYWKCHVSSVHLFSILQGKCKMCLVVGDKPLILNLMSCSSLCDGLQRVWVHTSLQCVGGAWSVLGAFHAV